MKQTIRYILIACCFLSCNVSGQGECIVKTIDRRTADSSLKVEYDLFTLFIKSNSGLLDREDFSQQLVGDTVIITQELYTDISNTQLIVQSDKIKNVVIKARYTLDINQKTTDDNPGYSLGTYKEAPSIDLVCINNQFSIPGSTPIGNNKTLAQTLGWQSEEKWIELKYFTEVKQRSYNTQKAFFVDKIKANEARYNSCCPEYVKQANDFLRKKYDDFTTLSDLSATVYYYRIELLLSGTTNDGKSFKRVLLYKCRPKEVYDNLFQENEKGSISGYSIIETKTFDFNHDGLKDSLAVTLPRNINYNDETSWRPVLVIYKGNPDKTYTQVLNSNTIIPGALYSGQADSPPYDNFITTDNEISFQAFNNSKDGSSTYLTFYFTGDSNNDWLLEKVKYSFTRNDHNDDAGKPSDEDKDIMIGSAIADKKISLRTFSIYDFDVSAYVQ